MQPKKRVVYLFVWLLVGRHSIPILRPLAIRSSRQLAPLYLDNNQAFERMDEQDVKLAHTRAFARSVGDIQVVGDGPTRRFKFMAERSEGAPLTLIREG
jgi:hypothetical protein